ncbi:MAG: signal peptidase I [bacterium]|nr:signal peptidase I [bacterium]
MENQSNFEEKSSLTNKILLELWSVVKIFLVALAIVMPLRYYVAQPFIVRGSSMEPNFVNREYLVVDELTYRFREPQRDEAIVLRYPQNPNEYLIKRIIGLPGEEIEIASGEVKIKNKEYPEGLMLAQPYLEASKRPTYPGVKTRLGEDEFFVLGDNRPSSSDSRAWGVLPKKFIVGRAMFTVLPLSRFGFVSIINN